MIKKNEIGALLIEALNRELITADEFLAHFPKEEIEARENEMSETISQHMAGRSPEEQKKEWDKITKELGAIADKDAAADLAANPEIVELTDAEIFSKLQTLGIE